MSKRNKPTLLQRSVFITVAVVFFLFSGVSAQTATIDETPPTSYPKEVVDDWKAQDGTNFATSIDKIKAAIPKEYADKITGTGEAGYLSACHWRRVSRMKVYSKELENIMFTKHHNFGGIVVGYHDNADASNADQEWSSKSALCVLNMKNYYSTFTELVTKTDAVVRDPCISFDGKKVLFAMSGNGKGTGYKIYEMEIANPKSIKQLTQAPDGMVVADFEPCYMPNGDIMFTSTRNFGLLDCSWNPTTNMFLMDGTGKFMRQVGFDQVHTFYPVLRDDGRVLYTRWEYNDRDVTNSMGLFLMNPDGCLQTEYFGNQTSWPMTCIHARPIPGSKKVIAVAGGHHGPYSGELMIIDPTKGKTGFNGPECVQMIAPKRDTKPDANKSDVGMGGVYFTFQNPYPFDEYNFLVSWRKSESEKNYKLYMMDVDGNRELIAWADQSVSQPVVIKPWDKIPTQVALQANYNDSIGIYTMQDVYFGEGMKGIAKETGKAKTLRVVKLNYRVMGSGQQGLTMGSAPSGAFTPAIMVPVSQYGAAWEAKEVLGDAKIYPDGSASFKVPARTPVYFQVLDSLGMCIANMRSWSTLMPGETFACVGCHENRNEAPPSGGNPQAAVPQKLDKPLGIEEKPFDYGVLVQPIFTKHCVTCHKANHASGLDLSGDLVSNSGTKKSWTRSYSSLLSGIGAKSSNKFVNIGTIFSKPEQQAPYSYGSSQSGIIKNLIAGHKDLKITADEIKIIACWIDLSAPHAGTYSSYMSTSDANSYKSLESKRVKWAAIEAENLKALAAQTPVVQEDHRSINTTSSFTEQLSIGYIPVQRSLILNKSAQGSFKLVDLRGRVLFRMNLSKEISNGPVTISLPASLGTGLYLARFESVDGIIHQAKISITQ